ncbi:hypothetical protein CF335_g7614, partial [Tilletia laevis]
HELTTYTLGDKTVTQVSQDLELLFNQVFMSGGEPVSQVRKVGIVLRVFLGSRFDAIRASLSASWRPEVLTFEDVIATFAAEESLHIAAATVTGQAPPAGAMALIVSQALSSAAETSQQSAAKNRRKGAGASRTGATCYHCKKVGHLIQHCKAKKNGQPPHPDSRVAQEQKAKTQEHGAIEAVHARLAAIESSLAARPGTHGTLALGVPPMGYGYQIPSLASRISEHAPEGWVPGGQQFYPPGSSSRPY